MDLDRHVDADWLTESIELALSCHLKAQKALPAGGWPQAWPLIGRYHDYYTFNDAAINRCIDVMLRAHRQYGRKDCLTAARRAGGFILATPVSPKQPGWAQQYDRKLRPAWARSFEPPGVCSLVTARNIRTLTDLYLATEDKDFLKPIPAAIAWLDRSRLEEGRTLWSRLYELKTNRPIYGDTDGKVHYTLAEISEERRQGYTWRNSFGIPSAIAYYRAAVAGELQWPPRPRRPRPDPGRVAEAVNSLDGRGRWSHEDRLYAADFVRNFNRLIDYLAAQK
jgi:hypothetical protein